LTAGYRVQLIVIVGSWDTVFIFW